MQDIKLAVTIPTRGCIFSDTITSTFLNPEMPKGTTFHVISGKKIPDSHNECIRQALATDCTHILFVEDDVVIPKTGVLRMMERARAGARHVAIDYGLTPARPVIGGVEKKGGCVMKENGRIWWTGYGCTMIDRKIFEEEFKEPWLDVDHYVKIESFSPFRFRVIKVEDNTKGYGGYDTWYGIQMYVKGIPLEEIEDLRCEHLRMPYLQRKTSNNGLYDILRIT